MPAANRMAVEEYRRNLNRVKREYTQAVLVEGPSQTELRRLSLRVADAVERETRAGREVSQRTLTQNADFRRLARAVSGGAATRSQVAEELLPSLIGRTQQAAQAFVGQYGLDLPALDGAGRAAQAAGFLTNRRIELPQLPDRMAGLIATEVERPLKPFTGLSVLDVAEKRLTAETAHTLTVMATETANAGREVIQAAIGPDGVWRWVGVGDELMCPYCQERNGRLFPSSLIFSEPHPRCRCVAEPV